MPRTRKPQASTPSVQGRGRVANTTTSSLPQVYRFWGKPNPSCKGPTSSVTTVPPLHVQIVGDNVYHVTLNMEELAWQLWRLENLDLSNVNVTLWTVDGPVTLNGNLTVDWNFVGEAISWTSITADTWSITDITSTTITTGSLSAGTLSADDFSTTGNITVWGTLWVTWATTLSSTLNVTWDITAWEDLVVTWNETVWGTLNVTWATTLSSVGASTWTITTLSTNTLDASAWATIAWGLTVTWNTVLEDTTLEDLTVTWNETVAGTLWVTWASNFTWDVSTVNLLSSGNASLNNVAIAWNETINGTATINGATMLNSSLTVAGTTTMWDNASVAWNLNVAWNEIVTGTSSVWGDTTLNGKLTVAWVTTFNEDVVANDDLTVNGSTHLAWVETTGSVDITWTLRTSWAINAGNGVYVTWQVESGSVVTTNTTTDNLTVNGNIALWNDATATDFVLQSEKWQPNWVAALDANGIIDSQYLPMAFPIPKVKVVQGVFNNSNTAVVVDEDITSDSWVKVSNYQDIVWDTSEVISVWQIVVTSNATETGSFKVLIVRPVE